MPEVGGKQIATDMKVLLPELRKQAAELRLYATATMERFTKEAEALRAAVKSIEDEADEMQKITNDVLGNGPPGEGTG